MHKDQVYHERALRIMERVLPPLPVAHGFHNREGFVLRNIRNGERQRFYWRTFARLRAKAEGGAPYLALPKAWSPALEGSAMHIVSLQLAREAGA